jgi:hypothetical protein
MSLELSVSEATTWSVTLESLITFLEAHHLHLYVMFIVQAPLMMIVS